jgi:flagellin
MPVVINTNTAASIASNNLAASNAMLQRSLNRLSSGSKIVNASDDAGGVAVAARLSAAAKRSGAIASNIGNGLSYLQQQDSALKTVGKIRIK